MNANIHPCPPELDAQYMELLAAYRRMEISQDEYNKRFAELQAEMKREEMKDE